MAVSVTNHLDFEKVAQIQNVLFDIRTSNPTSGNVVEAQFWYNSSTEASTGKRIAFKDDAGIVAVPRLDKSETVTGTYAFNPASGAPFTTTRTTMVTNLNAQLLADSGGTGRLTDTGAVANTVALRDGNGKLFAADATAGTEVVNYQTMTAYTAGIRDPKDSVLYATTAVLAAYTVVGNTLTASANGALTVDGATPALNDRILIKNETGANQKYNGISYLSQLGDASNPWKLTRTTDADASAEFTNGLYVWVTAGTAYGQSGWLVTTADPITLNTTAITFTQINGATQLTQGNGIVISGNTIHAVQSAAYTQYGVVYASTTAALALTAAGTSITILHGNAAGAPTWSAVSLTADVSGTLPVANGGTGATTLTGILYGNGTSAITAGNGTAGTIAKFSATSPGLANSIMVETASLITIAGGITLTGAQTIQTSTGNLTITTGAANGNLILRRHGTGDVQLWATTGNVGNLDFATNDGTNVNCRIQYDQAAADAGSLMFYTRVTGGSLTNRWTITNSASNIFQSNGAGTVSSTSGILTVTGTGGLTLSTASNNNAILNFGTGTTTITTSSASLSYLTAKSVLFAGASGAVSQDNANFQYDSTNLSFAVGTTTSSTIGFELLRSGAKTATDYGQRISATATSSTASVDKVGLFVTSTGTWNGASAVNYAIFINGASGGTTNWALYNNTAADVYLGSGKVGIGAATLTATFDLAAAARSGAAGLDQGWFQSRAATYTDNATAASGTATQFAFHSVFRPTLAATNLTVTTTDAAAVYIANDVAAGTNMTLTRSWALWVDAGNVRLDGGLAVGELVATSGIVNVTTGFRIGNAAAAGKFLRGDGTNYIASTTTLPDTVTANRLMWASATNVVTDLATTSDRVMVSTSGVPTWTLTMPAGLLASDANGIAKIKFFNVGDGASTTIPLTHSFNTRDVVVQLWRNSAVAPANYDNAIFEVQRDTVNVVKINFLVAPASNAYRCGIMAAA